MKVNSKKICRLMLVVVMAFMLAGCAMNYQGYTDITKSKSCDMQSMPTSGCFTFDLVNSGASSGAGESSGEENYDIFFLDEDTANGFGRINKNSQIVMAVPDKEKAWVKLQKQESEDKPIDCVLSVEGFTLGSDMYESSIQMMVQYSGLELDTAYDITMGGYLGVYDENSQLICLVSLEKATNENFLGDSAEHVLKTVVNEHVACTPGKATCITKATTTTNGKLETKCTVCGNVIKTETVYAAKTVKLDKTVYTYDGKTKKPAVVIKDSQGKVVPTSNYIITYPTASKTVGEYTVKVTFKGNYSGSKKLTFKINPVKTAISSLTAGSKSFTVKWAKKTAEVTGYQIQYSTSDKFKTGNKTVTITKNRIVKKQIKNLKASKKYFVRVRTYKTVGSKKFYSEWSAKKSVTTKK